MIHPAHNRVFVIAVLLLVHLSPARSAIAAPVVLDSAWTVSPFATIPPSTPEGVSVDGMGRVYVCAGTAGVFRFDTSGTGAPWSSAAGYGQATTADGRTFVPSRGIFASSAIWSVDPSGGYAALTSAGPGEVWFWAAVSENGNLYAVLEGGGEDGIYAVDPSSGASSLFRSGGPGLGGAGYYRAIATVGETVVASGTDALAYGVYSVGTSGASLIAATPQPMLGICGGPGGDIYAASGDASGGQVWRITPGSATLFAHGFGNTVSLAYDAARNRIYVQDQSPPKLWVISRNPTATRPVTIGRIHQLYR